MEKPQSKPVSPSAAGREFSHSRPGHHEGPRKMRKALLVPSLITVVGMFCGFLAILSAFKGRFDPACLAILLAFVLDGVDGRVARHLNATSAFGREFDSLSDLVAFGVAPAVLTYCWGFAQFADDFGVLVSFLFVACGAARLARFNVTVSFEPRKNFEGMPIPAAALAIISIIYFRPTPITNEFMTAMVLAYMAIIAGLMVSTVPFFSIKHVKLARGNPRPVLFLVALAVALIWYHPRVVLLVGSLGYTLSGVWVVAQQNLLARKDQSPTRSAS
jgi:CDP-diacylglycerol--serine O-phosphatidyltransferase